jgi:hypothetical protein
MADDYAKAQLIFLDEIAKRNAEAAEALRANPESVRQIIEAAVAALSQSLNAGTSAVVEAIRSAPQPEPLTGPVAAVQNAVVMQGNRQRDLLAAVVEAVKAIPPVKIPAPAAPVREWEAIPDRNFETGLIQSVRIKAVG